MLAIYIHLQQTLVCLFCCLFCCCSLLFCLFCSAAACCSALVPIRLPAFLFPASPTSCVDSLDSELWYHFGCRAAVLASAAPRPLGSLFGSFSPRGARSKCDQQPDGRVAHNQKLSNHPGCRYKDSGHPYPAR